MQKEKFILQNGTGLHARPASIFVDKTKKFKSNIKIESKGKEVNAKSIMSVMSLGIDEGDEIILTIDGEDEEKAMDELTKLINEELIEEE
ncbi:MAG: HPr family phosphocarrier protein [Bacillota bacterium]